MRGAEQPAGENIAADPRRAPAFSNWQQTTAKLSRQAVAALAASLPTLADAPNEPAEAAPEPESGQGAPMPAAEIAPSDDVLLPADEAQQTAMETGIPDNDTAPPQLASTDVSLSEAVLSQAFSDDYFSSGNLPDEAPVSDETESAPISSEEPPSEAAGAEFFDRARAGPARRSRRPVRAGRGFNPAGRSRNPGHRGCPDAGRAARGTGARRAAAAGAGNSAPAKQRSARSGTRFERRRADRAVQLARRAEKARCVDIVNFLLTKSRPQYDDSVNGTEVAFLQRGEADQQRRCVCLLSRGLREPIR